MSVTGVLSHTLLIVLNGYLFLKFGGMNVLGALAAYLEVIILLIEMPLKAIGVAAIHF